MGFGPAVAMAVALAASADPATAAPCLLDSKDRPVDCPAARPPSPPVPRKSSPPLSRGACVNPVTHGPMKCLPVMLAPERLKKSP
jgi:hypothetical protein